MKAEFAAADRAATRLYMKNTKKIQEVVCKNFAQCRKKEAALKGEAAY